MTNKWAIKWRMQFKSLRNVGCLVNIYTDDQSFTPVADSSKTGANVPFSVESGVTELQPSASPFFFEERDSRNLTDAIRYKTGYISFMCHSEDELEDLYPDTSTSRFVTVFYGNTLVFSGYLQCQSFSNKFAAYPYTVKIPVISPLGILSGLYFEPDSDMPQITIAEVFRTIIEKVNPVTTQSQGTSYQKIIFPKMARIDPGTGTDYLDPEDIDAPFTGYCSYQALAPFNESTITFDVSPEDELFSKKSMGEFITGFCKAFNYVLHDSPDALIFSRLYYPNQHVHIYRYIEVSSLSGTIVSGVYMQNTNAATRRVASSYWLNRDESAMQFTELPYSEVKFDISTLESSRNEPLALNLNKYWTDRAGGDMVLIKNLDPRITLTPSYDAESSPDITTGYGGFIGQKADGSDSHYIYMRFGTRPEYLVYYLYATFTWNFPNNLNIAAAQSYSNQIKFYANFHWLRNLSSDAKSLPATLHGRYNVTIDGVEGETTEFDVTTDGGVLDLVVYSTPNTLNRCAKVSVNLAIDWKSEYENSYIRMSNERLYIQGVGDFKNKKKGCFNNYIDRKDNGASQKADVEMPFSVLEGSYQTRNVIYPFLTHPKQLSDEVPHLPFLLNYRQHIVINVITQDNVSPELFMDKLYIHDWDVNSIMGKEQREYVWRIISSKFTPKDDVFQLQWVKINNN